MEKRRYLLYEVWEPLLRFLHWFNGVCILVLISIGSILFYRDSLGLSKKTIETLIPLHVYFGYPLAGGILIRWIWLFIGAPLSTWKDVIPITEDQRTTARETLLWYLRGLKGKPPFYVGHNPLAGIAYGLFFLVAAIQVITGLILNQVPPLPSGRREPPWFLLLPHDAGFIIIVLYILIHVPMVIVHEMMEKRSIVSAMIHGRKVFEEGEEKKIEEYMDSLKRR